MPDETHSARRWRGRAADAAVLLFVIGLGAKAAFGVGEVRDYDDGDECSYLMSAAAAPTRGFGPVEGSPLYLVWDWLIIRSGVPLEGVPVAGWTALAVLLPASVYLLVRSLGGGRAAALLAGGGLLATKLIDIWPYPMHLATLILVLGAALAARLNRAAGGCALGLTLLTATYARPEFLYSLALFLPCAAVGGLWLLWRRPDERRAVLASVAAFAAGFALLVWALGSPKGEGTRAVFAFGQHYALNRFFAGGGTDDPMHNWEGYFRPDFGPAATLSEAWRANPQAFRWHLATNAASLPKMARGVATPHVDLLLLRWRYCFPIDQFSRYPQTEARVWWAGVAVLALGAVGVVIGARRRFQSGEAERRLPVGALMLGLVAAPALASSLLIAPRLHYLIPTAVFAVALAASGWRHLPWPARWRGPAVSGAVVVGVAVALALVVPNRAHGWCLQTRLGGASAMAPLPTPMRDSVRTVRGLSLKAPVRVLDSMPYRWVYAGFDPGVVHPLAIPPGEEFLRFVERTNVGVVVLDPVVVACPRLRDAPGFRALADGKESALFRVFPVDGTPSVRIAVRRDLLPE